MAAEVIASPPMAEAPPAVIERERWLRTRFEREHEVALAMMRLLIAGFSRESRAMRFWRWLIDDLRSERREEAEQVSGVREHGGLTRLAVRLQRAWRSLRWRRVVSG